jgi:hypothetical protein
MTVDKENVSNGESLLSAEVAVLRDRLARVTRQYDQLLQERQMIQSQPTVDPTLQQKLKQLTIENEQLMTAVRQIETVKNQQLENLVRENADMQNKLILLQRASVTTSQVCCVPTQSPRNALPGLVLITSPKIHRRVVEFFYQVPCDARAAVLGEITNTVIGNTGSVEYVISILSESVVDKIPASGGVEEIFAFIRLLILSMGCLTDSTRHQLKQLRDRLLNRGELQGWYNASNFWDLVSVIPVDCLEGNTTLFAAIVVRLTKGATPSVVGFCHHIVEGFNEAEIVQLQRAATNLNIFIALSEILVKSDGIHIGEFLHTQSLYQSKLRSDAMDVLVTAAMKTTDLVALTCLRPDAHPGCNEASIGQRCVSIILQELLNESRIRALGGHDTVTRQFLPCRIRLVKGAMYILTRLGAVWSETATACPIEEYSLLIPSVFGLIRELLGAPASDGPCEFSDLVKDFYESGDLHFLKELQSTIPGFEIESSQWPKGTVLY